MERKWFWAAIIASLALSTGFAARADDDDQDPADETEAADSADAPNYPTDAVFDFLLAEVLLQRGDLEGALKLFNRLAREMQDPQIARRAVETAIRARAFGPALDSATLLLELDPES